MIPPGMLLLLMGERVNVYGELLIQTLLGRTHLWAMAIEHFLISWGMAFPLVLLLAILRRPSPLIVGLIYGAGIWLVINSLLLPAIFSQPNAWQTGWPAIWPSLSIHLIYGVATAITAHALMTRGRLASQPK